MVEDNRRLSRGRSKEKIWAVYRDDDFLVEGTVNDIAEYLGVSRSRVMILKTPSHQSRSRFGKPAPLEFVEIGWKDEVNDLDYDY